jgi:hypothetical protein
MLRRKLKRRITDRRAPAIIQWLNSTIGEAGNDRISWLLKTAPKAASLGTSGDLPYLDLSSLKARGSRRQMANSRKLGKLVRELNRRLSFYKSYPEVRPSSRGHWYVGWKPLGKHDKLQIAVLLEGEAVPFSEGDALRKVLDLAKWGELHRVRKCDHCERWYFARVRHQNYCGISCQQSNFRTSPRFRTKRRLYMRDYRRREYSENKKAKRFIRRNNEDDLGGAYRRV